MSDSGGRPKSHGRWAVLATLSLTLAAVPGLRAPAPVGAGIDTEEAKVVASDAEAGDRFGGAVAVDGDTMVVGANEGDDVGAVYVFVRSGEGWSEQAKLTASDAADDDRFGRSVGLSGDTVVVGAYWDDDAGESSGSAYVYVRSGSTWSEQAKLTASDAEVDDFFGQSVAVSDDTVVVGADEDDDPGARPGSAYVFVRSGSTWSEQAKLTASDAALGDAFGRSVGVSGETVVVGAPDVDSYDEYTNLLHDRGAVYVFVRSGSTWSEQAKLSEPHFGWEGDLFGGSVAVSGDTLVAGAARDDDAGYSSGSAFVFVRSGAVWSQQAKLNASDAAPRDYFGRAVGLSGDTVVVGAYADDDAGPNSGSAYVFVRSGSTWSEQAKLTASDAAAGANFGAAAAVWGDTVVVGARGDGHAGPSSGSAYVFVEGPPRVLKAGIAAAFEGIDGQVAIDVPITLSSPAAVPVTVDYTTVDVNATGFATPGVDHEASSGTVTFAPGQTAKAVTLTIFGDNVYEPDHYLGEWALVKLSSPSGATIDPALGGHGVAIIGNDDPVPVISPGNQGVLEGDAGSTVVQVPVTLSNPSSEQITIEYTTVDNPAPGVAASGADYEATSGTVTFAPGETSKSVPVTVFGDTIAEPPLYYGEWIVVAFSQPVNASLTEDFGGWGLAVIIDDD